METERVTARRTVLSGPLLASLAFVLISLLVLRSSVLFGIIGLVVFGPFLLYALAEVAMPPSVRLSPTTIRARTLLAARTYAWADCHDFRVWTEGRRSVVVFGYRGTARGGLSDADSRRAQADRALPSLPGVPADVLLTRIEDFRGLVAATTPRPRPRPRPSPR